MLDKARKSAVYNAKARFRPDESVLAAMGGGGSAFMSSRMRRGKRGGTMKKEDSAAVAPRPTGAKKGAGRGAGAT